MERTKTPFSVDMVDYYGCHAVCIHYQNIDNMNNSQTLIIMGEVVVVVVFFLSLFISFDVLLVLSYSLIIDYSHCVCVCMRHGFVDSIGLAQNSNKIIRKASTSAIPSTKLF